MRQNGFVLLPVIIIILLGVVGYFVYQNTQLKKQMSQPQITPIAATTPTPLDITNLTVKPTAIPTASPNVKILKYSLPTDWLLATSPLSTFEVGYNPETTKIGSSSMEDGVLLLRQRPDPNLGYSYCEQITLYPYNGGSRHQFIYGFLGFTPTSGDKSSDYRETEYIYNGHSCLFLNGISHSQLNSVWGMCDIGNGKAFLISTCDRNPLNYEVVIQTIKLR